MNFSPSRFELKPCWKILVESNVQTKKYKIALKFFKWNGVAVFFDAILDDIPDENLLIQNQIEIPISVDLARTEWIR